MDPSSDNSTSEGERMQGEVVSSGKYRPPCAVGLKIGSSRLIGEVELCCR